MREGFLIAKKDRIKKALLWIAESLWRALQSLWLYVGPKNKYVKAINDQIKDYVDQHGSTLSFLKALAINPQATGALLPSSKQLAKAMASQVIFSENSLVVELGAGTGVITSALLEKGIPPQQIIAIENSPHLAKELRQHFPEIKVIEGDAVNLLDLLKEKKRPISTIISSLPLRSLSQEVGDSVLSAILLTLSQQGRFIQFTYDIRDRYNFYPSHYHLVRSKIIWRNIPPARVCVFEFHTH